MRHYLVTGTRVYSRTVRKTREQLQNIGEYTWPFLKSSIYKAARRLASRVKCFENENCGVALSVAKTRKVSLYNSVAQRLASRIECFKNE